MATFKFVLSKLDYQKKKKSPESLLMLRYTHKKKTTHFSTHKNIDEKYWDERTQMVKRSYPGSDRFNIYIKGIRQKVEDIVNGMLIDGNDPTTEYVKSVYNADKNGTEKKKQYTFFEYAEKYLENGKNRLTASTIKSYRTALHKLEDYQSYSRSKLDWMNIDIDFYYDFMDFYTGIEGLTNNGFGKIIKNLKAILNFATEDGYNTFTGYQHKKFKTVREDVNNIYLSEDEISKLLKLDLSGDRTMERTRDLFVFGCYTGLRFSDFSQVKQEHIVGDILRIKTIKTSEWVNIPILPAVREIMDKYKDNPNYLPKSVSNQTMNRNLKDLGEMAKINDKILKIRNKGKERIEDNLLKYQMICTHTARRSFATNMFKRGVPTRVIMNITGHRTEKAFNSYIKISQDENAELLKEYFSKSA